MTRRLAAAAVAALFLCGGVSGANDLLAALHDAATSYYANLAKIAKITSRDTTMDYYQRLLDDQDMLSNQPAPVGYDQAAWEFTTHGIAELDLSLANQLLTDTITPMASIRGLGETFVRSSKDGSMQPVAVYVPASYVPGKAAPLIVFLHGNPQSESQLLAPRFVRELAEANGTILIAPYGRGYYDFRRTKEDVYDALDAAEKAFTVDSRKRYLVGYSMGGFSVFEVAPDRPNTWSAVMCISGALLGSDAPRLLAYMPNTPFYVLTGIKDESIPTEYPTITASYLSRQGVPVSFYSLPNGIHRLISLLPILTLAWSDMLHGVVRSAPPALGNAMLPTQAPATGMKT
jgi:predicted esterase